MSHPLRAKLLAMLNTKPASSSELEILLGDVHLSNISYHVRELLDFKLIEPVRTEQVRGATKTVYRGTTKMELDNEAWLKLSTEAKDGISIEAVKEVLERASIAIKGAPDRSSLSAMLTRPTLPVEKRRQGIDPLGRPEYGRKACPLGLLHPEPDFDGRAGRLDQRPDGDRRSK